MLLSQVCASDKVSVLSDTSDVENLADVTGFEDPGSDRSSGQLTRVTKSFCGTAVLEQYFR